MGSGGCLDQEVSVEDSVNFCPILMIMAILRRLVSEDGNLQACLSRSLDTDKLLEKKKRGERERGDE